MAEDIAAIDLTDRVFGLINARDEHAGKDNESYYHKQESPQEFERAEDGFDLNPSFDELVSIFAARLGCKTLTADESAFFTNKSFELSSVPGVQSTLAALIAPLELTLTPTVCFKL